MKSWFRDTFIVIIYIISSLFFLCRGLYIPLIPLLIEDVSSSLAYVGFASSLLSISLTLSQYLWGLLSDYFARRKLFLLIGLSSLISALFLMAFIRNVLILCILRAIEGIGSAAFLTLAPSLLGDYIERSNIRVGKNIGIFRMLGSLGFATSCLIMYFLLSFKEIMYREVFLSSSFILFLSLLLLLPLEDVYKVKSHKDMSINREKYDYRIHYIFFFEVLLWSMSFMTVTSIWPNFVKRIGYESKHVYLLWSIAAYGEVPLMFLSGIVFDKLGYGILLRLSAISLTVTFILYYSSSSFAILSFAQLFRSIAYSFFEISTLSYASSSVMFKRRGRLIGLRNVFINVGWSIGSLLGGLLAELLGMKNAMLLFSLIPLSTLLPYIILKNSFIKGSCLSKKG